MRSDRTQGGPLKGLRVLEFAGLAPAPFACMMLADLGADVIRLDRARNTDHGAVQVTSDVPTDILGRGRRSIAVDLKGDGAVELVLALVEQADVLVEGFRPGVLERLGLGPETCLARNPQLIYGRMTGWGQDGPLASRAGHDINYIAVAGALHGIGERDGPPVPPANLLGDFAGGGLLLAFGVLAALFERTHSGEGQVVDAAMVDGAAVLTTMLHGLRAAGAWHDMRGSNLLDGAAPFYDCYETADGEHVAVGAIEEQFYEALLEQLGVRPPGDRSLSASWSSGHHVLAAAFKQRSRDEWCSVLEHADACVSPVLSLAEAPDHPHNKARQVFVTIDGIVQPAPAPRFSRTPPGVPTPPPTPSDPRPILSSWGVPTELIAHAVRAGSVADTKHSGNGDSGC